MASQIRTCNLMASAGSCSLDEWKAMWTKGVIPWHIDHVDKMLQKYFDLFTDGRNGLNIFVPLCGKSVDLKWLADKGYKAFGVDISERAVSEIFTDAGLSAKVTPVGSDSTLYEACDGKLKVLAGDVFSINSDLCGQFDCIWSKHSFGSINPVDRDRYVDLIYLLLKPKGKILLTSLSYERTDRTGPPFPASTDLIKSHYGSRFTIKFLESEEWTKPEVVKDLNATSSVHQMFYLLQKTD